MVKNNKYFIISTDSNLIPEPYEIEFIENIKWNIPCILIKLKTPFFIASKNIEINKALIMPRFKEENLSDETNFPKYLYLCNILDDEILEKKEIKTKGQVSIIDWVAMYKNYEEAKMNTLKNN